MGIPSQLATILLREHAYRPIGGKILCIGRQTVNLTPDTALGLVERELGFRPRMPPLEIDHATRAAGDGLITDRAFFSLFSGAEYNCLDISGYEGANIIADLCQPLPAGLEEGFDFIVEGSCLDNLFDPAAAIRNLARLLKPDGRIVLFERASRVHHVYLAYSLAWFHDYFAVNDFADCQVYLVQWENLVRGRWDLYHYSPAMTRDGEMRYFGQDRYHFPFRDAHALVIAEKQAASTWSRTPVQYQYRPDAPWRSEGGQPDLGWLSLPEHATDPYFRSAARFARSSRPNLLHPAEAVTLPDQFFHYDPQIAYCGSLSPFPAED